MILLFEHSCFATSFIIVVYQNLYLWMNYGIFKHNEYFDLRTG